MTTILRSLRYRNYRLFFLGNSVSHIGNWMQWAAMGWLVLKLTGSPLWLGMVGFCRISILFVAPFAGVVADRFDRRNLVVATQSLAAIQPAILAILTLGGWIHEWHILALSTYAGLISAFDIPIRQSFVVEMIDDRRDLPNAIALNSSMVNAARLLGPALGGVIIAVVGEGWCFLLNALSYAAVVVALLAMRIPPRAAPPKRPQVLRELVEGARYAAGFMPIRTILMLLCLVSVAGMPYQQMMPAFAREVLDTGPKLFGLMMSCVGIGALSGAAYLASRRSAAGLESVIALASAVFGAGLVLLALAPTVWLAMPLLVMTGFGMMVNMASSNTVLQTIADDDKRGRVMSFYTMAFMGTVPLGQLLAGSVATAVGVRSLMLLSGTVCLLGAGLYASRLPRMRRQVRPIYERLDAASPAPAFPVVPARADEEPAAATPAGQ